jgi:hypothetical protein
MFAPAFVDAPWPAPGAPPTRTTIDPRVDPTNVRSTHGESHTQGDHCPRDLESIGVLYDGQ